MNRYLIVIEQTATGYSAYSPDLPGCIATASSRAKLESEMQKAIEFHVEGLRLSGYPVLEPRSQAPIAKLLPSNCVEPGCADRHYFAPSK